MPTALITGASRGLGAAIARSLAPTHDLLLGGRPSAELDALATELDGASTWPVELTDHEELAASVEAITELDVVVHNAGVVQLGEVAQSTIDQWRYTFEVNLFAVVELTRLLLPALRAANGQIIFINSGAGLRANPGWSSYAASKFALRAFADSLRAEEPSLRITSVHPGRIDTDMQREVVACEGRDYVSSEFMSPTTVAEAVRNAVLTPTDAQIPEISIKPY
ncbi:MAG: SDR family oxidoreductase [Mycobacteriaceae bacterium]